MTSCLFKELKHYTLKTYFMNTPQSYFSKLIMKKSTIIIVLLIVLIVIILNLITLI